MDLYCDQVPDAKKVMLFSMVLVEFKENPGLLHEGRVMKTTQILDLVTGKLIPFKVEVVTKYGKMRQTFHPSQVKLKGNGNGRVVRCGLR